MLRVLLLCFFIAAASAQDGHDHGDISDGPKVKSNGFHFNVLGYYGSDGKQSAALHLDLEDGTSIAW